MRGNLKRVKLGDVVSHKKGHAFKSKDYQREGVPIVRVSDLTQDSIDLRQCMYLPLSAADQFSQVELIPNDIIITTVGSWEYNRASVVGKVIRVPPSGEGALLNQNAVRLRAHSQVDQHFLYYRFKCEDFRDFIVCGAQGSANQAAITLEQIFKFEFDLPNKEDQSRIAAILSSFDDKIELNRRMNQTLEQMAQALFNHYFVDNVDPDNLPEGWRIGKLGDIYRTTSGGTPSRAHPEYYIDGVIPWVKSKELNNGFILNTEEKITSTALTRSSAKLLPAQTVLVAMYGATVGEVAVLSLEATCNQAICAVLPNVDYPYTFIFEVLKNNKLELINRASGSAQQNISQLVIQNFELLIPSKEVAQDFHTAVHPIYSKVESNLKENMLLTEMRDALLPQLMSGQLNLTPASEQLAEIL